MFFSVTTFGCKVNQYESSAIREIMTRQGYISADFSTAAENIAVHIINSCTVTEKSDNKVKSHVAKIKKLNPDTKVVLCGCFPKAFPEKAKATGADIIIPGIFKGFENTPEILTYSAQSERTRAFLKIQDGCNRDCAYCIIPKARGAVTSRSIEDIRKEAEFLARAGHKEIVVTGINICAYEYLSYSFADAVEAVCGIDGISRVRLGSIEPDMITESDIAKLSSDENIRPKLCGHFHLSLQSGSNSVLKRMNRQYTADDYRKTVDSVRRNFPDCAVTTDIIVGFPGESDREFAECLSFAEEIGFAKIHVFAYSSREGTTAAVMPGQVPASVKKERVAALGLSAEKMRADFCNRLVGSTKEVLMEKPSFGRTRCYTPVKTIKQYEKNIIVNLKIIKAERDYVIGQE